MNSGFGIRCSRICCEILLKCIKPMRPSCSPPRWVDRNNQQVVYFVSFKVESIYKNACWGKSSINVSFLFPPPYSSERIATEVRTVFPLISWVWMKFKNLRLHINIKIMCMLKCLPSDRFEMVFHMLGRVKSSFLPNWSQVVLFWYLEKVI